MLLSERFLAADVVGAQEILRNVASPGAVVDPKAPMCISGNSAATVHYAIIHPLLSVMLDK